MKRPIPAARLVSYGLGMVFYASGACLATKAALGLTPVTSVSYVLSLSSGLSLGTVMLLYNVFMLLVERAVYGKDFQRRVYLQLPLSIVFSGIVDIFVYLFRELTPVGLPARCAVFAIALILMALGITGTICGNFIPLPAEGVVQAFVFWLKTDFGPTKLAHDCTLVAAALVLSLVFLGYVEGIQIGTLVAALSLGPLSRMCIGIVQPVVHRLDCRAESV